MLMTVTEIEQTKDEVYEKVKKRGKIMEKCDKTGIKAW